MGRAEKTEKKINAIIKEILNDDRENYSNTVQSEAYPRDYNRADNTSAENSQTSWYCKCAIEHSSRFSLKIMEAMRWLQRDMDHSCTCTAEDIIDYITANYRCDGDVNAQVLTALRQVCSQGFVLELLDNEYYLIGPVVRRNHRISCSPNCEAFKSLILDDTSRRRRDDREYDDACDCTPRLGRNGPLREEIRRQIFDLPANFRVTEKFLHSTRKSAHDEDDDCQCGNTSKTDNDNGRDIAITRKTWRRETESPIAGPSREFLRRTPKTPTKRARLEDRRTQHVNEDDEETTTDDDLDCTCDIMKTSSPRKRRTLDRSPDIAAGNRRRKRGHRNAETNAEEEKDGDTEDSVYKELQSLRAKSETRERELKRWIRRCKEECQRQIR